MTPFVQICMAWALNDSGKSQLP